MAKTKTLSEKDTITKELKSLIPKLDEEGLAFLLKQAQIHLYNMQVDELNRKITEDSLNASTASWQKTGKTKTKESKKTDDWFKDIKISGSKTGYHILCNTQWVAFTTKEISSMVKIAKGTGTNSEVSERLYNWLARERSDLLNTALIANKFDEKLKSLISMLKKNF